MSWWRTQDHIHFVTACHPTWLRLYQFMLVEMPGKVPEGSNADTLLGSGGLCCRYRIPVAVLEGSGADTWSASGGFLCRYLLRFLALVPLPPLHVCMCMLYDYIQSRSSQTVGRSTWVYFFYYSTISRWVRVGTKSWEHLLLRWKTWFSREVSFSTDPQKNDWDTQWIPVAKVDGTPGFTKLSR